MAMWFHGPARKTRLNTVIGDVLRAFHKWVGRLWHLQLFLVIGRRFWNVLKYLQPWSDSNSSWGHVWKIESDQTTVIPNWEIGWICFFPFFPWRRTKMRSLELRDFGSQTRNKVRRLWDVNLGVMDLQPPSCWLASTTPGRLGGMSSHPPVRSFPTFSPIFS